MLNFQVKDIVEWTDDESKHVYLITEKNSFKYKLQLFSVTNPYVEFNSLKDYHIYSEFHFQENLKFKKIGTNDYGGKMFIANNGENKYKKGDWFQHNYDRNYYLVDSVSEFYIFQCFGKGINWIKDYFLPTRISFIWLPKKWAENDFIKVNKPKLCEHC